MGLCREKVDRDVEIIMPTDQCAQHRDTIQGCIYEEGLGMNRRLYIEILTVFHIIYILFTK